MSLSQCLWCHLDIGEQNEKVSHTVDGGNGHHLICAPCKARMEIEVIGYIGNDNSMTAITSELLHNEKRRRNFLNVTIDELDRILKESNERIDKINGKRNPDK